MSSMIISLIVSLLSGGAGAKIAVSILKQFNLGPIGNLITGALGGVGGNSVLGGLLGGGGAAAANAGGFDIGALIGNLAGGGVGGAVLTIVVGIIKNMIFKK